jgi:signal transduction histidine kinase
VSITPGESTQIAVRDDGPGFDGTADQRHLEPFFSTRGHLGLGLNLARRIVHRGEGRLEIAAGDGGGVVATLVLPHKTGA